MVAAWVAIRWCNEKNKESMPTTHKRQERETNKGIGNVRHKRIGRKKKGDWWMTYGDEGVGWPNDESEENVEGNTGKGKSERRSEKDWAFQPCRSPKGGRTKSKNNNQAV